MGFADLGEEVAYRIVLCTTAAEKTGKTHFAFSAPGPIAAISTDTGTIEVAKPYRRRGKKIIINHFKAAAEIIQDEGKGVQNAAEREWKRCTDSYTAIIGDKRIRTLVIDTGSEMWELCRLARFGKLTQVMPHHYGPVNAEFRAIIKGAYDRTDLNCIFIHKVKKEYKAMGKEGKECWTGRMERAGFSDFPYLVDCNIRHYFAPASKDDEGNDLEARFGIDVIDSRINMLQVVGTKLEGDLCTFQMLAETMFPETIGSGMWE